jgi:hypothetical protein
LAITGCSTDRQLVGKYVSHYKGSFQFRSDHTFLNDFIEGETVRYSSGKWKKIAKDTIVLTSDIPTINVPLGVTLMGQSKTNTINLSIDLRIEGGMAFANYHCYMWVNNKDTLGERCDAISLIQIKRPVHRLSFMFTKELIGSSQQFFPVTTDTLDFDQPLNNDIKLKVVFKDIFFEYNPFNNFKITVDGKDLKIYNAYLNKWEILRKLPNSVHIFAHWEE